MYAVIMNEHKLEKKEEAWKWIFNDILIGMFHVLYIYCVEGINSMQRSFCFKVTIYAIRILCLSISMSMHIDLGVLELFYSIDFDVHI